MYGFIDATWNVIKGKCPIDCEYCYMKVWGEQPERSFRPKELKTDLGEGKVVFVGSSCDMWAEPIKPEHIKKILEHCKEYPENEYFFQSKQPMRFWEFYDTLEELGATVCTTVETNRIDNVWEDRIQPIEGMNTLGKHITIEPVMDFDVDGLISLVSMASPDQINIGANSRRDIDLDEPSMEKVQEFISVMEKVTDVYKKDNLKYLKEKVK